jgi:hypothetical protein
MAQTKPYAPNPVFLRKAIEVELKHRAGYRIGAACEAEGIPRPTFYLYRDGAIEAIANEQGAAEATPETNQPNESGDRHLTADNLPDSPTTPATGTGE